MAATEGVWHAFRPAASAAPMTMRELNLEKAEGLAVRLVPISATQIQALESLARALSVLSADFWRDYGAEHDHTIAGGLYRLTSTLEMIVEQWRDESEDVAVVEGRRRALEQIAAGGLTSEQIYRLAVSVID